MTQVDYSQTGLFFPWACLTVYQEGTIVMALFVICLLLLSGHKERRALFLWPALLLLFTVFNPLVLYFIFSRLNITKMYYRCFWLLPAAFVIGTAVTGFTQKIGNRILRAAVFAACLGIIALTGKAEITSASSLALPQNVWKVPDDLIEVCSSIHELSDEKNPKAALENNYEMLMRQYDPSIGLSIDRTVILYEIGNANGTTADEDADEGTKAEYQAADVLIGQKFDEPPEVFLQSLRTTGTDFIVLNKQAAANGYLADVGLAVSAETSESYVYAVPSDGQ